MRTLAVPSALVALRADRSLAPAMVAAVWEIAAAVDAAKVSPSSGDAVWLSIPASTLRGEGARSDNVWLRECLERLTGVRLSGEHDGDPWGAVLLAEWRLAEGGSVARLLIPPAGITALRAPANFARLEADAVHRLPGHARRLYAVLADKRRLRRAWWSFSVDELRALLGVDGRGSYARFNTFRQRVLDPALAAINDFGTVSVTMTPERVGRSVAAVRFDWRWRDPHQASEAVAENARHSSARRRKRSGDGAPPMIPGAAKQAGPAAVPASAGVASLSRADLSERSLAWWRALGADERDAWAERVGRFGDLGAAGTRPRPERILAILAFEASVQEREG